MPSWAKPSSVQVNPLDTSACLENANARSRPPACTIPPGLGDRDAAVNEKGRSRAMSSLHRDPPTYRLVANGTPLDLRELILASVLRSSFEPRLHVLRRKPRFQCKASSWPHFRGAGSFAEGTRTPRLGLPSSMPCPEGKAHRSHGTSGCECRRIHNKQRYRPGRLMAFACSYATSAHSDCTVIPMVAVQT